MLSTALSLGSRASFVNGRASPVNEDSFTTTLPVSSTQSQGTAQLHFTSIISPGVSSDDFTNTLRNLKSDSMVSWQERDLEKGSAASGGESI